MVLTRCFGGWRRGSGSGRIADRVTPHLVTVHQLRGDRHVNPITGALNLMYAITEVTTAVVVVNLLHQLNIPTDWLTYSLTTSGKLERASRLAREHWPADAARSS